MKNSKFFLFIISLLISRCLFAQEELSAFIIGGDTTHLSYLTYNYKPFSAVVLRGGSAITDYNEEWYSVPAGYVSAAGDLNSSESIPPGTRFDVYCRIEANSGEVLLLQQHVIVEKSYHLYIPSTRHILYAFTGKESVVRVRMSSFDDIQQEGYQVTAAGSGEPNLSVISEGADIRYGFKSSQVGIYNLMFYLKDQNDSVLSVTEKNIEVVERGALPLKPINLIGESYGAAFLLSEAVEWDSIQWKSDDPSSAFFGEEWKTDTSRYNEYDEPNFVQYISMGSAAFMSTGTFTCSARLFLGNGEVLTFTKDYTVTDELAVEAGTEEACVGDTVSIPLTFRSLNSEIRKEYLNVKFSFDHEKLLLAGIVAKTEFVTVNFRENEPEELSLHYTHPFGLFFEPDDTICQLYFIVQKSGTHMVTPEPVSSDVRFDLYPGQIITESADFHFEPVPGMPLVFRTEPVISHKNDTHFWTYGVDSEKSSSGKNPVINHLDQPQEICYQRTSSDGCLNESCQTVAGPAEELYSISGVLQNNSGGNVRGKVVAYFHKEGHFYPAGTAMASPNGSFSIQDLQEGSYILLGLPEYTEYNAAYYYGKGTRSMAVNIPVKGNVTDINLVLSRKQENKGETISGKFKKDSLTQSHENIFESFYGELPSVVFLTTPSGEIVDWSLLGDNGSYTVSNRSSGKSLTAYYGRVTDEVSAYHGISPVLNRSENSNLFYPNPFHDKIIIEADEDINVECLNLQGKLMFEQYLSKGRNSISTTNLPPGGYLIRFQSNQYQETFQIVKI